MLSLAGKTIRVSFTEKAVSELELAAADIKITLLVPDDALIQIGEGLARIFAGTSAASRPRCLALDGANLTSYGTRPKRTRTPRRTILQCHILGLRGALADVEVDGHNDLRTEIAPRLAQLLGIPLEQLPGTRYTCAITPDLWGQSYTDFRVI